MQDHRLKGIEPLRVPSSVLHPAQIFQQVHHKASPDLPAWRVVVHDREITPPPLPSLINPDAIMKVSARVELNPFPIELIESEVLQGRGVAWNITPFPLPVLLIHQLVAPNPSLRSAGICSRRSSGVVTARKFSFPLLSYARPCLLHLCTSAPAPSLPCPCLFFVLYLLCLFLVLSGLGRNVGTLPRHHHDTQMRSALCHLHRAVLHVNLGPHLQQASTARQSDCYGAVV